MSEQQPATAELKALLKMEILIKIIAQAVDALQRGQVPMAEKGFASIRAIVEAENTEPLAQLLPIAIFGQSLIAFKQGRHAESKMLHAQAASLLSERCNAVPLASYHYFMALVLQRQLDYRNALPFWETALQNAKQDTDPMLMAEMLREIGEGYCHMGLSDHAVPPLRAALKILETCPEHPWRSSTLLTLGNALRKSAPAEAERLYREAAESHASRLQFASAAPAWVNLGILCSEQGRYAESLEFYQKVLRVREGDAATPPARIATLHNNIANCYRRMKNFDEALASVDRSLEIFPAGDPLRAYASSTRAMTLRDAGRDEEAAEWFRKAIAERNRQPSPNFEAASDDLQGLIDALKRLGRQTEMPGVEQELEALRRDVKAMQPLSPAKKDFASFTGGSVLIELPIGSYHADARAREELRQLIYELQDEVKSRGAGRLTGHITLPENRTLIFTGAEAETLFKVIEPMVAGNKLCSGARVTIRQDENRTEFQLQTRSESVN
jgi:tetratricopeptide (TPR) repeat protein